MKGVYFLIKGEDVIYIGQSLNIERRIWQHRKKDYDFYVLIQCDRRKALERKMIKLIQPTENVNLYHDMTNFILRIKPKVFNVLLDIASKNGVSIQHIIKQTLEEKYL